MKFTLLPAVMLLIMLVSSCSKNSVTQPEKDPSVSANVPGTGATVDQNTGSGVNSMTGYEELQKHYVNTVNSAGQTVQTWDGQTYDGSWYGYPIQVQVLAVPINGKLGDPVYGLIIAPANMGVTVTAGPYPLQNGSTTFSLTLIQLLVAENYSSGAISAYSAALKSYFNGTLAEAPTPPGTTGSGTQISTVYGKIIKTPTGVGLAEIKWVAPVSPKLPYTANTISQTLNATVTTAGGVKTVVITDNTTLSNYTPTFTFKLNASTNHLTQTVSVYNITSTYTFAQATTWSQASVYFPMESTSTNPETFTLVGQFTNPNVSHEPMSIVIRFNPANNTATIKYNDPVALAAVVDAGK